MSLARDPNFVVKKPVLILLAGHQPGTHVVQAIDKASATVDGRRAGELQDCCCGQLIALAMSANAASENWANSLNSLVKIQIRRQRRSLRWGNRSPL